jgi:hypothetical protein
MKAAKLMPFSETVTWPPWFSLNQVSGITQSMTPKKTLSYFQTGMYGFGTGDTMRLVVLPSSSRPLNLANVLHVDKEKPNNKEIDRIKYQLGELYCIAHLSNRTHQNFCVGTQQSYESSLSQ